MNGYDPLLYKYIILPHYQGIYEKPLYWWYDDYKVKDDIDFTTIPIAVYRPDHRTEDGKIVYEFQGIKR